jgi:hypothetical protein
MSSDLMDDNVDGSAIEEGSRRERSRKQNRDGTVGQEYQGKSDLYTFMQMNHVQK